MACGKNINERREETAIISSPVGYFELSFEDNFLIKLCFIDRQPEICQRSFKQAELVEGQLNHFFSDAYFKFDLPLKLNGTSFQKKVWSALEKIPTGETLTYGDLAKKLKTSPRAIGNACRANPIPIIIPCHRVIGKSGLTGYAGKTSGDLFDVKGWLLKHEGGG